MYRLRLMRYIIDMKYIQGKTNIGADGIRSTLFQDTQHKEKLQIS